MSVDNYGTIRIRDAELVKNSNCKILSVLIFVVSIALFFVGLTVVDLNAFESCHFVLPNSGESGPHQRYHIRSSSWVFRIEGSAK